MEDIRFYDFSFRLLHIEHAVKAAYWTLKHNGVGTFEGTFPMSEALMEVLFSNRYLLIVQGAKQAIVTGRQAGTEIALFGKTVNWLLTKRSFPAYRSSALFAKGLIEKETVSHILTYIIENAFSHVGNFKFRLKDGDGNVYEPTEESFLKLGIPATEKHYWRHTRRTVSEIVTDALDASGCGHRMFADIPGKEWVLEIYRGKARGVMLSEDLKNYTNTVLTDDLQEYCTGGWFDLSLHSCGELDPALGLPGADADRAGDYYTVSYGEDSEKVSGFSAGCFYVCMEDGSWEVHDTLPALSAYVSHISPEEAGGGIAEAFTAILKWDAVFSNMGEAEATEAVKKQQKTRAVSGTHTGELFEKTVFLGDTVCAQAEKKGFRAAEEKMVLSAEVWFEGTGSGEKLVVG
ncbi:MAG: hypothetical protein IJ367_00340 [Clostridia bacterium]|nr:hypothetical protein [Clostridia bacterium]